MPVKTLSSVDGEEEHITLCELRKKHITLLDTYRYKNLEDLISSLESEIISPAEVKANELDKIFHKTLIKAVN